MSMQQVDLNSLKIDRNPSPQVAGPKKTGWIKWLILLVVVGGITILALKGKWFESAKEVRVVSVNKTFPSQANAILTASGYIVPQRQAAVASKGQGQLMELLVVEGDQVQEGQLLAKLDDRDLVARLNQARADLKTSQARLLAQQAETVRAEKEWQRQKNLLEQELTTGSEYDAAFASFESAKAQAQATEAEIQARQQAIRVAEVDLSNMEIRAPFSGTVLTKNADVGEMVAPFAGAANSRGAVVTMADMQSLQLEADVSEAYIQRVQVGQGCDIVLDAFTDKRYRGEVAKIVPTANRAKATILVKIRFLEIDNRVLPEMSAKVYFMETNQTESSPSEPLVTIPKSAVFQEDGSQAVWVVEDNTLQKRLVQLGQDLGNLVEVRAGVLVGQQVVASPEVGLKSGDRIRTR
ncbi:MAG: efflux RND transporter periplasmic adaptor subunit [Acidobacteria bacterium]|nr:efflux RND transporter periplasmic adaptor subunit [Acidobacteriota bacterium]MCB9396642.1 efflux RND transporter periplasmic adaptor subunit [Acidobacteriota bacterium]